MELPDGRTPEATVAQTGLPRNLKIAPGMGMGGAACGVQGHPSPGRANVSCTLHSAAYGESDREEEIHATPCYSYHGECDSHDGQPLLPTDGQDNMPATGRLPRIKAHLTDVAQH